MSVATRERPIFFSGPMILALLEGRKTQTRRVMKFTKPEHSLVRLRSPYAAPVRDGIGLVWRPFGGSPEVPMPPEKVSELCPIASVGDRLWVRETLRREGGGLWVYAEDGRPVRPAEENRTAVVTWAHHKESAHCSSIHMPRWASRLALEITDVRAERLQQITEADVYAEGCDQPPLWPTLWDAVNGKKHPWASDPWVWPLTFRVVGETEKGGS